MASGAEGGDDDGLQLHLWQRAAFIRADGEGRTACDSLRLQLALLEFSQAKERSNGQSSLYTGQLMESYYWQYSKVMDNQDTERGMDNLTAPVKVLSTGAISECKSWKSGLSFESVLEMPEMKALMKEKEFYDDHPCPTLQSQPTADMYMPSTSVSQQLSTGPTRMAEQTNPQPQLQHSLFSKHNTTASGRCSSVTVSGGGSHSSHSSSRGGGWGGRGGRKKARRMEDSDEEEGCMDVADGNSKHSSFLTARDQYVINQRRKFGQSGEARGGGSLSSNSYGVSKKSLGTRRGAGSARFVPPVKKGAHEEDGSSSSSLLDEVASRVGYGGGSKSSGSSKLPPELEGNEQLRNVEPKMVELIMNEIMDHGAPVCWEDIAGLQFAKAAIKEIVVWPMKRPDLFTGLRGPPKGILLFGPPGTGKTLIGKCIASQVEATFFSISASSLTSKWVGEGEKMVRALFAVARCHQPAVIFIDEIDSLLSKRSDSEHESSRRIKTEFLVQLDGATTSAEDRLLVVGATNRPQEIDEAARRRLVKRLYIPLPDGGARKQIVTNLMREQPFTISDQEMDVICTSTEGYSGADMANLCREAAYGPVREAAETIEHISIEDMRVVLYCDFEAALKVVRPSVSEKDLGVYTDWNRQFGCCGENR